MRKFVLIFMTMLALSAAFVFYFYRQPVIQVQSAPFFNGDNKGTTSPSTSPPAGLIVGKGNGVWVEQYDRDTGKRSYQFKADFYDPQPDGTTVHVRKPVVEFFQGDGQIVHVEGDDGDVRVAPGTDRAGLSRAPAEPPRYGTLHKVVVKIFNSAQKQALGEDDMTLTMSNAEFDNDTFRLFTEEYTDNGRLIRADQVPVDVVAKDYRFEGSGMVMYWNGLDKRLKSLDIYHAKRLTILHASALSLDSVSTSGVAVPTPAVTAPSSSGDAPSVTPAPVPTPASAPSPDAKRNRYTATILQDVQVWQGGQEVLRGEKMDVDFMPKGDNSPVPGVGTSSAAPAPPVAVAPAATPATQAVPDASQPPIEVYWKGMLHIVPTDESAAGPLSAGQSTIHVVGKPVQLNQTNPSNQQQTQATCAELTYRTADAGALLVGSAESPLILTQKRPDGPVTALSGHSLDFSRRQGIATIAGEGAARFPDPNDPKSVLNAAWNKSCVVHFTDNPGSQQEIQNAKLSGGVLVDHPKFRLTSNDLVLAFEPPAAGKAGGTQLKEMDASGDATCIIREAGQQNRSIAGQRLRLMTAREKGKLFAKTILADGAVKAVDDAQTLTAEHLDIELLPAPERVAAAAHAAGANGEDVEQANVLLDQLTATDSVHVAGNNGSSAEGDWLQTVMVDGHPKVTVTGQPAKVSGKNSTVTGAKILFSAVDQTSSVDGPGSLTAVQQSPDPRKKGRPMLLHWDQGANVDGKANEIDVNGNVSVESKGADGTVDTAHGDRVVMMLMDKPTTRPSRRSTARTAGAGELGQGDMDFMGNKEVKTVSLRGDGKSTAAQLESTLNDPSGKVLRHSLLFGQEIDYDTVAQQMTVPGAGQLRTANNMPGAPAPGDQGPMSSGARGTTAFVWDKELVYDEAKREATIVGGVRIAHVDQDLVHGRRVLLDANKVIAEFQPIPGKAATRPVAPGDNGDTPQMQLSKMTAEGAVRVLTENTTIHCGRIEFDPAVERLKCFAGDDGIVTVVDSLHPGGVTCSEVWLDTKTNTLEKMIGVTVRSQR